MTTLVLAEHNNTILSNVTARTVTAANRLGKPIHVLVAGDNCSAVAETAAALSGVSRVILVQAPYYEHQLAEPMAALIVSLASSYSTFIASATVHGRAIMPRVSAMLDIPQISEVVDILSECTFKKNIYSGTIVQTLCIANSPKILTVRTSSFSSTDTQSPAPIENIRPASDPGLSAFVEMQTERQDDHPDLATARIVLAGGRGVAGKEGFLQIEKLAVQLGAAVGATRAAIDGGMADNEKQIGQSGEYISPDIYIAFGISGAIQHIAGIRDAKIIAAVNKDPEAPIFSVADIGFVADLFSTINEIEKELKKRGLYQ